MKQSVQKRRSHQREIIDKSKMEIPQARSIHSVETMMKEFAQRGAQSGLSMDQYHSSPSYRRRIKGARFVREALTVSKSSLVLEQIKKLRKKTSKYLMQM